MHAIAKINLFLRIVGKRPDGYHNLETLFLPIPELYDDVELIPAQIPGYSMELAGGYDVPADNSNLCIKAADAFSHLTGLTPSLTIRLTKRIPVTAGLGGGSSDAAAVLTMLNDFCGSPLTPDALTQLAASIGADVPFFLNPVPAVATGIGDVLTPLTLPKRHPAQPVSPWGIVIAAPCFPLPVAWAYAHRLPPSPVAPTLQLALDAIHSQNPQAVADAARNDLEIAILEKFPLLNMMRETMLAAGACAVHVSGSGPSLFAVAPREYLQAVAKAFADLFRGQTVISTCDHLFA